MYAVKLPYYPSITAHASQTRYGMIEVDRYTIYDKPISGRKLARVDTLYCLKDIFGVVVHMHRNYLYRILAGTLPDTDIKRALCMFYRTIPAFRRLVNDMYYYGENTDLFDSVLKHILTVYHSRVEQLLNTYQECHAKELMHTHGYVYYSLHKVTSLPETEGVRIIC